MFPDGEKSKASRKQKQVLKALYCLVGWKIGVDLGAINSTVTAQDLLSVDTWAFVFGWPVMLLYTVVERLSGGEDWKLLFWSLSTVVVAFVLWNWESRLK